MKDENRFRRQYRVLSTAERERVELIKDQAAALCSTIESLPESREREIAITKLEESVMFAVKAQTS
jgi:hypothetical protein